MKKPQIDFLLARYLVVRHRSLSIIAAGLLQFVKQTCMFCLHFWYLKGKRKCKWRQRQHCGTDGGSKPNRGRQHHPTGHGFNSAMLVSDGFFPSPVPLFLAQLGFQLECTCTM